MIYIIAGNHQQADRFRRELALRNPRTYMIITTAETAVRRLRGRKWNPEHDRIYRVGTYYENDQTAIRQELFMMGVPKELL